MKDGRETGFLEEHRNGEPYALKGARTVRKGPERKGLAPVPRSQATLLAQSLWGPLPFHHRGQPVTMTSNNAASSKVQLPSSFQFSSSPVASFGLKLS